MTDFLQTMFARAKQNMQTIILPEGDDYRVLEAAEGVLKNNIARLVILGDEEEIAKSGFDLSGATIINPLTSDKLDEFANAFYELRKHKGITPEKAQKIVRDPMYFAVMMVKLGYVGGMVGGASHSTADVLRPSLQILKTAPGSALVSSFFVMHIPDCEYGDNGTFLFADCALEVQPNSERLAHIAVDTARSAERLLGIKPIVAMLSHSSYGSAINDDSEKVYRAAQIARMLYPELCIEGDLQLDSAVDWGVGKNKTPGSIVSGRANILIFPDIDAGNIGYKLVHRFAKANAYGPITQGLAAPVNDLSRGCSAEDIEGVIAITAVQAAERERQKALENNK